METESRSAHVLKLSSELLDDIELVRLTPEALILKATRLARLVGNERNRDWLWYGLNG